MKVSFSNTCYPIHLAVSKGNLEMVRLMLNNPTCDPDVIDEETGVTAYWLACYYGHLNIMRELNIYGVDIYTTHKATGTNVLHLAVEKRYRSILSHLIECSFDLDIRKTGGVTALMIACRNKESENLARDLINNNADVNLISEAGRAALTESIMSENHALVLKLLSRGAHMYFEPEQLRNQSPFFYAIDENQSWAIDLFCDHGADLTIKDTEGLSGILHATKNKVYDISLYLALRVGDSLNSDVDKDGKNAFVMYMERRDYNRCRQLIIRGAKVNHMNK